MTKDDFIQVLWVDCEPLYQMDYICKAEKYGINLVPVDCWDDAHLALSTEFKRWSAIIIEPKGKLHKGSYRRPMELLPHAFADMAIICERNGRTIPWYILSGADPSSFETMIIESRKDYDGDWSGSYYERNTEHNEILLKRIKEQSQKAEIIQIRTIYHKDVFDKIEYLENHGLSSEVQAKLAEILVSLHYSSPINDGFKNLRSCLEAILGSMIDNKLVPKISNISGHLNVSRCIKFLSGKEIQDENETYHPIVTLIGNKTMIDILWLIYNVSASGSHSSAIAQDRDNKVDEHLEKVKTLNIYYILALGLCDFIVYYYLLLREYESMNYKPCLWSV